MKSAEIVYRLGMTDSKYFEQELAPECNVLDEKNDCFDYCGKETFCIVVEGSVSDLDPISIYSGYVPYVMKDEEDKLYFGWYKKWSDVFSNFENPVDDTDDWKVVGYKIEIKEKEDKK